MPRFVLTTLATTAALVLMVETSASAQVRTGNAPGASAGASVKTGAASRARPGVRGPVRKRKPVKPVKLSRVQLRLQRDLALAEAVRLRLPSGSQLMEVSAGFDDVAQFVAAVNASRALNIPMREFRRRMVADRMPLLLAIQDIRPKSNYRAAARTAEAEAAEMIASQPPALTLANGKG
jgi:hypothetical protein